MLQPETLSITEGEPGDAEELRCLWELTGVDLDVHAELSHAWVGWWVARQAGHRGIVGALLVWRVVDEIHVQHLGTHPDFRRRGIGRALLSHVVLGARAAACTRVLLEVHAENHAAQSLYRSLGFRTQRVRHGYYADGGDAFEMDLSVPGSRPMGAGGENGYIASKLIDSARAMTTPELVEKKRIVTMPLLSRRTMGTSYHVLTFDDPGGSAVMAGQFAMVRGAEWGDAPLLPRPMSYLTGGDRPSILIKVVGEGTRRMGRAEPGEPFVLLGPLGQPWRPHDPSRRQVLVGGGVGIAPLLFLARQLAASGQQAVCLYGGRSRPDLPLSLELEEVSTLSLTTEDGSVGTRGRVTDVLEKLLDERTEVYTCGPNAMMAKVAAKCAAVGVPCEASLETPMGCGYGVCLGCPVPTTENRYVYACVAGPCLDGGRIDWPALLKTKVPSDEAPSNGASS